MALIACPLALALSLTSLVCSTYFLAHSEDAADSPIFVCWTTLSAAILYVLLCFAIISYLRQRGQQQPRKDVESSRYRISRRSNDNTKSSQEMAATDQHHSASTFYYCGSSFAAIHLNSGKSLIRDEIPLETDNSSNVHTSYASDRRSPSTTKQFIAAACSSRLRSPIATTFHEVAEGLEV